MPEKSFTDAEWRRLLKSQSSLRDQEEELLQAQNEIFAKLMRLRKQEKLLRKRAGDFIARECEDIAELEELERREAEELQRLEDERIESERKEREAESSRAASERIDHALLQDHQVLAATSEDPTLTQIIASVDPLPSLSWDDLGAFLSAEVAKSPSPVGGTVEPAGGSPSGSR
jgi:septal ring factor EnvC (AmiA/AmiB activator)